MVREMTRRSKSLGLIALAVAAALAAAAYDWWSGRGTGVALDPGDPALVALGEGVYGKHCASCHGANLEGQPGWRQRKPDGRLPAPPQNASGHTWHHPDELLFDLTKFGPAAVAGGAYESDMPGFEGTLTDREIIAALSFIKSRWPDSIRRRQTEISRRAADDR